MKIEEISSCRLCNSSALTTVFDFGLQALSTRFPGPGDPNAEKVPLELLLCGDCGLTQLAHNFDLDDLYRKGYGYRSGINETMREHLHGIAHQLEDRTGLRAGDTVLDIASNDGTLLRGFDTNGLQLVGIDPNIVQYREFYPKNTILSPEFFTAEIFKKLSPTKKAKAISSIAVFYDVPNPIKFASDITMILDTEGVWVLEQSYLPLLIEGLSFDSICHEHLGYYCLKQIYAVAESVGLRVFDAEINQMNGGSIRLFLCHKQAKYRDNGEALSEIDRLEQKMNIESIETFAKFHSRVIDLGHELIAFLTQEKSKGRKIHIYGASTKGNVLLQLFGIDSDLIDAAAERNEWKYGHRTPGTNIPIISEEESRANRPDYYLVLPWHFREEFIAREKEFISMGGKLVFPLPQLEIYPSG
jgi:hypothetical protein